MTSNYLNLNKQHIRKSVVNKLNALGYQVDENTPVWVIKNIIMKIQHYSGLMIDGHVGVRTMTVLGYSWEEIRKMLKIPKYGSDWSAGYNFWLLWN